MRAIHSIFFYLLLGIATQTQAFSHLVIEVNPTLEAGSKSVIPLGTGDFYFFWR